ncbi:hypothetical protein Q4Q34_03330 [Flavivirga abyssicola]|uniref:hypothetical protein n=1 Tax=Flavivirga abyssicola TaxID=3063533 RepID=UPI0026DEB229|nr:hypothetical protein [Flavivirga sp. MEBiC07777]WVK14065.1 hypothetical protein Q4Q34_03330 [Flavivirga sp. MEBiC07777]
MSRNTYILIITILFSLVYIPSLVNTILFSVIQTDTINFSMIPKTNIKLFLLVIICFIESSLIKKQYPGLFGWILSTILIIAILMRVIHWPYNAEMIIISVLLILSNLIYFAIKEKNKTIINYLLMAYLMLRISIILFRNNDFFWWLELIIGCSIITLGILNTIKRIKKLV